MRTPLRLIAVLAAAVLFLDSCAVLRSARGLQSVFLREEDPMLAEQAFPVLIKGSEVVLEGKPRDQDLVVMTASLLVMYGSAFVEGDAEFLPDSSYAEKQAAIDRAGAFYARALRLLEPALERRCPGALSALALGSAGPGPDQGLAGERAVKSTEFALGRSGKKDLPLLYWTAAALLSRFAANPLDSTNALAIPGAMALLDRVDSIEAGWNGGSVDEIRASLYASLPSYLGGDMAKAEDAWNRAFAYSKGMSASLHVLRATGFALPNDDYAGFKRSLELALAVDTTQYPDRRLATELAKRRARNLLAKAADLFVTIPEGSTP